ncbi:hypothetical protein B0F90DRAFT_1755958 [Multifurca ochricompacta]|uniref:C2H2-type domain-containing protein n=1 Tax=Multifurca ochricompacta TaxID=376703 RepID=A0AAD4LXT0_9AGAM|nr:hypothetical protein B0F90DRAFT_1755958 [Multifurca ochricompacta]
MAYCDRCMRWFPHNRALEQHVEDSNFHWPCDDCDLDFKSYDSRKQHYIQSRNHHYCRECDRHFSFEEGRRTHMNAKHFYCENDDTLFNSYEGLQQHDREAHNYCTDCKRSFQNATNLWHHLNSKLHKLSSYSCPGSGCTRSFISAAALALHLESGTCPSGMTRIKLDRFTVRIDEKNYITNPRRLITGPDGGYQPPPTSRTWATDRSWNGWAYECFLCNNTYRALSALNQHLQSPRHQEKIYRCPKQDCRTEFVTLSGLCQHVEGGSCGVRMFQQVRDVMDKLTRRINVITI